MRLSNSRFFASLRAVIYALLALYVALSLFNLIAQPIVPYKMTLIWPVPPTATNTITISGYSIVVVATIFSHAIIAERTPVTLHAAGSMGWDVNKTVTSVSVVFDGAYKPINGEIPLIIGPIYAGVDLTPTKILSEKPEQLGVIFEGAYLAGNDASIEWLVQNYYYPRLVVRFVNGSSSSVTYTQYPVHVESYSTLESERANGNLQTIEVAALAIAMSEGLGYFDKLAEKRERNKDLKRKNNKTSDKDAGPNAEKPPSIVNKRSAPKKQTKKQSDNHPPTTNLNK